MRLWQTLVGLVFVFNAFLVDWFFAQGHTVASASGLIGAVILGYPIVLTAIKDLRGGILSINELVAIAVLAAFATLDHEVRDLRAATLGPAAADLHSPEDGKRSPVETY